MFKKSSYPKYLKEEPSIFKQALIFLWEIFKVIVISLAIVIPIRYFLIQPFYVKGASMEPNFFDHEYLIIDEISYRFSQPQRGEVVVFKSPFAPHQYLIKRIIGLPGEKIKISQGQIYIYNQAFPQGLALKESYLSPEIKTSGENEIQLGLNEYYLLGDNRISSLDSRVLGPIPSKNIIGRALLRGWPLNRFGLLLEKPEYNL